MFRSSMHCLLIKVSLLNHRVEQPAVMCVGVLAVGMMIKSTSGYSLHYTMCTVSVLAKSAIWLAFHSPGTHTGLCM